MHDKTTQDGTMKALGDEIWSELVYTQNTSVATGLRQVEVLVAAEFIDLVMGVLARRSEETSAVR